MIKATLIGFLILYATWFFYLAIMNLKRARDAGTLSKTALRLAYPGFVVGLLLDVLSNLVLCFLMLDIPRELLVTSRLKRYVNTRRSGRIHRYRRFLAVWAADMLLDDFDPSGKHI